MVPTHSQKKHWRVLRKWKHTSTSTVNWDANAAGGARFVYAQHGYLKKMVLSKPWVAEFDNDANGALPSNPQGPYTVGISSQASGAGEFARATAFTVRTYFIDS